MALARVCPFCLLPQATECLCDIDEADDISVTPGEESAVYQVGTPGDYHGAEGLEVLRTAAEGATAPQEAPDGGLLRYGLVIELPKERASPPLPIVFAEVALHEIGPGGTERPLHGATALTVHLSAPGEMTADVESLVGEDGEPLVSGAEPVMKDGEYVTAVFRYVVAAARVTDWRAPRAATAPRADGGA